MSRWRASSHIAGVPVGLPPVVERPDVPVRARTSAASQLVVLVLRPLWLCRREWSLVLVLVVWSGAGWLVAGGGGAAGVPVALVLLAVLVPGLRRGLGWWLARGRLRRRWDRAARFAGLATSSDRIPRILRQESVPVGDRLVVRIPRGLVASDVEKAAEHLAADLAIREVRVVRDVERADRAHVHLRRRDPLEGRKPLVWPWLAREAVRLWEPVPVGLDEMGGAVSVRLPGRNLLVGGEPESGKSAALSLLLGGAALDPLVRLVGLDAKRLELALWSPVMSAVAYADMDDAIALVEMLISDMDSTYRNLEAYGLRKVPEENPLTVLVVDEMRFYTAHSDRKAREKFNALLIDLVARGRAAGYIVVAATQKPSADVVPTSLRDLFAYRWAMRCTTRDASDTILGAGWSSLGYSAATIPVTTRGVGLLLAEGSPEPVRSLSYYLTDDDITGLAARGADLRQNYGCWPGLAF